MKTEWIRFLAATAFLTRLPVPEACPLSKQLEGVARYFPLVGLVVGVIGALTTWVAGLILPFSLAVLLGMMATILVTGAFHEDGFSDACDGFGGGWDREQILTIMKDSRIGSYGAIGITLLLLTKWNALRDVSEGALLFVIIAAHAVSRFAAVVLVFAMDYVREEGKSKAFVTMSAGDLVMAGVFGLMPCLLWPRLETALALLWVMVVTFLSARYFLRRLGGYTGDCLGATQQMTELAFYVGFLAQWNFG
ncbi:MAG: adenosylcobinamide-GDP ribazoletransferase [Rhodocyclaceae bacterium]|nr:adenosylcobinamide-GDP ribazoletransferase [Rhodocyclaceae bacterium]